MSVEVAILKSIRRLIRDYSNRKIKKLVFLGKLCIMLSELEKEAYREQENEALQDVRSQEQEIV
jgi:hypothetical protein